MPHLQFDPYRDWLGLPGAPTSFYGLLSLNLFEADLDVIQKAAHRAKLTVRNVKPGPHIQAWKQLLDQIERGRSSLADPQLKAQYDASLVSDQTSQFDAIQVGIAEPDLGARLDPMAPLADVNSPPRQAALAAEPLAVPAPPTQTPPTQTPPTQTPPITNSAAVRQRSVESSKELTTICRSSASPAVREITRQRVWRKQKVSARLAFILIGICFVGMLSACWFILQLDPTSLRVGLNSPLPVAESSDRYEESTPVSDSSEAAAAVSDSEESRMKIESSIRTSTGVSAKPRQEMAEPKMADRQERSSLSSAVESLDTEMNRPNSLEMAADPANVIELTPGQVAVARRLLIEAHRALSEQGTERGEDLLQQLRSIPLGAKEEAMVDRFAMLQDYVSEFWKAVDDGTEFVEGTELTLKQTTVFVVEVNPRTIVLRVLGKNRRIDRGQIPSGLALALADRWFNQRAVSTKVFKGAYMAVTPRYEVATVKQMWSDAASEGVDLGDLMEVLDDRELLGVQTP